MVENKILDVGRAPLEIEARSLLAWRTASSIWNAVNERRIFHNAPPSLPLCSDEYRTLYA